MLFKKWEPEAKQRLVQLWGEKRTAKECADILNLEFRSNLTRNAVLGKTFRLGLQRKLTEPPKPEKAAKPIVEPRVKVFPKVTFNPDAKMKTPPAGSSKYVPPPEETWRPLPNVPPMLLVHAGPTHCRWPVETGNTVLGPWCCGAAKIKDSPYCGHHHKIGNYPLEPRHAKALRYITSQVGRSRRVRRD